MKLKSDCIPGRPGCVLEGKVNLSEEILSRLKELEKEPAERRKKKRINH